MTTILFTDTLKLTNIAIYCLLEAIKEQKNLLFMTFSKLNISPFLKACQVSKSKFYFVKNSDLTPLVKNWP